MAVYAPRPRGSSVSAAAAIQQALHEGAVCLGNCSALEWVIDQYQVSTDKRSGIVSDPNREDDQEYIVRLVGRVVRLSVETAAVVKSISAVDAGI